MKIIGIVLAVIMAIWSMCDFLKIYLIKKRNKKLDSKVIFTATKAQYLWVALGVFLCGACLVGAYVYGKFVLVLLSVACLSGAAREFTHCYYVETEQFMVMNGREISYNDVKDNGKIRKMSILSFITIFEVCTKEYREYVYVKKNYECKWLDEK